MVSQTEPDEVQTVDETTERKQIRSETGTVDDATSHPILFFDGVCGLCNCFVDFLLVRDSQHLFRFAPLQGETAGRLIDGELNPSDETSRPSRKISSVVLLDNGKQYRHSAAVVRILRRLGGGWRIAAGLLWAIPWPIRDAGYWLVAASRYRLFGKKETCRLPTAAERERFLP